MALFSSHINFASNAYLLFVSYLYIQSCLLASCLSLMNDSKNLVPPSSDLNLWSEKPWWCQPWTIILAGILAVFCTWIVFHRFWISILVALFVFVWWLLFLVIAPAAYKAQSRWEALNRCFSSISSASSCSISLVTRAWNSGWQPLKAALCLIGSLRMRRSVSISCIASILALVFKAPSCLHVRGYDTGSPHPYT